MSGLEKNIGKMELEQLLEAQNKIADLIKEKQVEKKSKLESSFQEQAQAVGLGIAQIIWSDEDTGAKKPNKRKRTFKPKYRNPENPEETWTGLGKKTKWLEAKLKAGHKLTDFLIPEEENEE